ncbi:MAG: hypothetical protein QOE34_1860 [Verrucomicrobiota bacterium]
MHTSYRLFFVIWLSVAALFVVSHFSFYFLQPHYEGGDFAANALQIRQAKVFHELYGNYSRFGFHHPGPAFFYVYALGETILFDALKIVPAPYNAHALAGILIHAFFFAWALSIVAKRFRRPLLVPLFLVFAAVHFGLVNFNLPDSAFESIWPPYVLLFPFLCFLVAAASVASGEVSELIPLVLSGCVLVHGHVAQPLFVLPLFVLAYAALYFSRSPEKGSRFSKPLREAPYTHLCAGGILLLFLLPLVLDVCRGEGSNLHLILRHFSEHAQDHKSWAQSFIYFVSFLCYLDTPETYCDNLTLGSLRFLTERWYFLALWALVAILLVILPKRIGKGESGFVRWLSICFGVALFLTIVWGKLQNAEMFAFNAHFNFALLFVPFVLLAIVLSSFLDSARFLRGFLYAAAISLGFMAATNWRWNSSLPTAPHGTAPMIQQVRQATLDDRQSARVKFLSFASDDWEWAAGVALALGRFGYGFAIPSNWSFIFGASHRSELVSSLPRGEVALWKIRSPALGWDKWISTSVPAIDPSHGEIAFSGPGANAPAFAISGWERSGETLTMNQRQTALLYFVALPAFSDVQIDVLASTLSPGTAQRMSISFNDGPAEWFEVSQESILSLRLPKDVWNSRGHATLALSLSGSVPDAAREQIRTNPTGCRFIRIDFHPVNAASDNSNTGNSRFYYVR